MSNIQTQSWLIDRRHALRAMGTCVALPMLECMIPLNAKEKTNSPRRSAFIYLANGVHSLNYQITKPGKDYQFSRSLKPLEKFRNTITPISGLHHPGSLGHHHNCINVFLTGGKIGAAHRNTISVDQKMARGHRATHPLFLQWRLPSRRAPSPGRPTAFNLPAQDADVSKFSRPSSRNPRGASPPNEKPSAAKPAFWMTTSPKCARLSQKMSAADKGRLDQYLTSVREAEIRTRRADTWLDTPLPKISEADRKRTNRDVAKTQAGDYFRTVYDLMVLAFQTDVTRVVTFSLGGEGQAIAIPEIGITESRHQLSHHGGDEGYMEKLTNYDTFAIEQFSYFLIAAGRKPRI